MSYAEDFRESARWDWVVTGTGTVLHHAVELTPDGMDYSALGVTSCGIEGTLYLPGVLTRMASPRCKRCSRRLGWPEGVGSPKNDDALRELVQAQEVAR